MAKTKADYQDEYPYCEIYCQWRTVPENLKPKRWFIERGVKFKRHAPPVAVKVNLRSDWAYIRYFLYDIEDYREQMQSRTEYKIFALTGKNGSEETEVCVFADRQTAETTLRQHQGKMFEGKMAVWELREEEIFEEKKNA